jgi:predicted Ser/Thr protein kinase
MEYLSKGKRGVVYLATVNEKRIVVKKAREDSDAILTLENEARWLKILNKYKIGPRFVSFSDGMLRMEYIHGQPFVEWMKKKSKKDVKRVVKEIFEQCRVMDNLKVNKLEMHHPVKHIIMRRNKPYMIDFERCKKTLTPKNVTQFCQFLVGLDFVVDKEKLKTLLQEYKETYDEKVFRKIVSLFC